MLARPAQGAYVAPAWLDVLFVPLLVADVKRIDDVAGTGWSSARAPL
jgi:hypothetical protein